MTNKFSGMNRIKEVLEEKGIKQTGCARSWVRVTLKSTDTCRTVTIHNCVHELELSWRQYQRLVNFVLEFTLAIIVVDMIKN